MTRDEIREAVIRSLLDVAPEVDPARIRPEVPLRDQLDIDSMDMLNVVVGIDRELGVDVPETDYGRLTTLDATVDYLAARLAERP